ncbi:hypothetical protein ISS07_06425 [Candidatus Woesearchaeota archaeon]|nr:hypothetical protein [Candidatus Woesearchaeota archaeon]
MKSLAGITAALGIAVLGLGGYHGTKPVEGTIVQYYDNSTQNSEDLKGSLKSVVERFPNAEYAVLIRIQNQNCGFAVWDPSNNYELMDRIKGEIPSGEQVPVGQGIDVRVLKETSLNSNLEKKDGLCYSRNRVASQNLEDMGL